MTTFQDTLNNANNLSELIGSEIADLKVNFDIGNALDFNGSSDYVSVADADDLSFGNETTDTPFTIFAWVYMHDSDSFRILTKKGTSFPWEYALYTNGLDELRISIYDNSSSASRNIMADGISAYENQWIHIAATYDGNELDPINGLNLYINGVLSNDDTQSIGSYVAMHNTSNAIRIGGDPAGPVYSDGLIGDTRIYAEELSQETILAYLNGTEPDDSNLIAHWDFSDGSGNTLTDITGNGHDGDLTGHAPDWVSGQSATLTLAGGGELRPLDHDDGTVLSFNGSSQYGVATGYKGVTGTSACTVMGWLKTTDSGSGNQCLIYWGTGATFARRFIGLESGVLWDRMVTDTINGGSNLADGQWHHWAIVNPAGAATNAFLIYIDGESVTVNTTTSGGTINIGTDSDVTIAALPSPANYYEGSQDDIRIYNTVLTADQIYSLVHAGIEPPTTNLQAQWLFNEGSGSTVNDETANNRDLTLTNSPTWVTTGKPFYTTRTRSTSTELVSDVATIDDFDFTVLKQSAATIGRLQVSSDGSTWVNANGDSLTGYGAYNFDGVNDVITCGSDTSIDNIFSGGGTVMFWFYARSKGETNAGRIFSKGPNGSNANSTQVLFDPNGYLAFFRSFSSNDGYWFINVINPLLNQWNHCAITYNESSTSNDPTFYLNGVAVASSDITENTTPSGSATTDASNIFKIGSRGTDRWFDGLITDLRVYKGDILSNNTIFDYFANATEPSETLDAHWKFNGNALDETANNNDGSVTGAINTTNWYDLPAIGNIASRAVRTGTTGNNKIVVLDGNNDSLSTADHNDFSFGNGSTDSPFSVSAWVYMHDATNFKIVAKDDNNTTREWLFHTTGGDALLLQILDESTNNRHEAGLLSVTHLENQWIHVAATYDGRGGATADDGIEVYVNGNNVTTYRFTSGSYTAMENTTQVLQIGARGTGGTGQFANGAIANVAIWDDVRTAQEIQLDCENGWIDTSDANIVAYWALDGSNYVDAVGGKVLSASGVGVYLDNLRPAPTQPTQQKLDVSGLGFTDFYYRFLTDSNRAEFLTSLTEVSVDYLTLQNIVIKDSEGATIADGETTPQDFGETDQGEASPSLTFTIQNTGEATLTISSIDLPSGYSISGSTPSSIAGGASDTFTVVLSTATVGTFSGDIVVNSNDPDTAAYNFAITGEILVTDSDITIKDSEGATIADGETTPQDFGQVYEGATSPSLTFTIENEGATLTISSINLPSGYSISGDTPSSIAGGASDTFTVVLSTGTAGTFSGDIVVNSNDPDTAAYNFAVTGTVLSLQPLEIDLVNYLISEVSEVSSRVYPYWIPRNASFPCLAVHRRSGDYQHNIEGSAGFASPEFQFSVFSYTYDEARSITEAVRQALHGYTGTMLSQTIYSITGSNEIELYEEPQDASERGIFHIASLYRILYEFASPSLEAATGAVNNSAVHKALLNYLLSKSALTDLIGTRLHFLKLPRGTAYPAVVCERKSGGHEHDIEGSAGFAQPRFDFTVYATNYPDCLAIRDQLRLLLDGLTGVYSGCNIYAVTALQSSDSPVKPADGSETWSHAITIAFNVLHQESVPNF